VNATNETQNVSSPPTNITSAKNCTDSDGGIYLYTKGTTTGIIARYVDGTITMGSETDSCRTENYVIENYCYKDGSVIRYGFRCVNGCSDGACIPSLSNSCLDKDGGINYYMPGFSQNATSSISETINSSGTLFEVYCDPNNNIKNTSFFCSGGFSSNLDSGYACINISEPCIDTDNGQNFYEKGAVKKGFINRTDICSPFSPDKLSEFTCEPDGNFSYSRTFLCPSGICRDGACLPSPGTGTVGCTDSDGGKNYYTKGIASNATISIIDGCVAQYFSEPHYLSESYCDPDGNVKHELSTCPSGCIKGACIDPTISCSDNDGGKNYYSGGIVISNFTFPYEFKDYCGNQQYNYTIEYYCQANGTVGYEAYSCPNGPCTLVNGLGQCPS
jgi:hypothetical protein